MGTGIFLKARYNYVVRNSFDLFLDFSRPDVFDFTIMPSHRTPNGSNVSVQGYDATWVHGVFHESQDYFETHRASLRWIHRSSVYDLFLWVVGLPFAFWTCFKVSPLLPHVDSTISQFLRSAVYVYLFFIALYGFRALFHYFRWIFPITEFRHPKSNNLAHRAVLSALVMGIVSKVVYDIFKAVFAS